MDEDANTLHKRLFMSEVFRKTENKILLIPGKVGGEEEELTKKLSYEYRNNFSRNLREILYGDEDVPVEESARPEFLINRIFDSCYTRQERVDMIRDCLRKIESIKIKKSVLIDNAPVDEKMSYADVFSCFTNAAERSKYTEKNLKRVKMNRVSMVSSLKREESHEYYSLSPDLPMEAVQPGKNESGGGDEVERKRDARFQLKRQHFRTKNDAFLRREKQLAIIQSLVNMRKRSTPNNKKGPVFYVKSSNVSTSHTNKYNKDTNSKMGSNTTSFATVSHLNLPPQNNKKIDKRDIFLNKSKDVHPKEAKESRDSHNDILYNRSVRIPISHYDMYRRGIHMDKNSMEKSSGMRAGETKSRRIDKYTFMMDKKFDQTDIDKLVQSNVSVVMMMMGRRGKKHNTSMVR